MRSYTQQEEARAQFYENISEEEQAQRGEAIAKALYLKRDKAYPDRYITSWGTKTPIGLFRTLQVAMEGGI